MTLEEQLAIMANNSPEGYAAAMRPQGEYGAMTFSPREEDITYTDTAPSQSSRLITTDPTLGSGDSVVRLQPYAPATVSPTSKENASPYAFLDTYRTKLDSAKNWEETQSILLDMNNDATQRIGKAYESVSKLAEQDLNIPAYRKRLNEMIATDKRDRNLQGMDSPETAKMRAAVLKMEEQARKTADDLIKANPELKSFASTVNGIAQKYSKVADQKLQSRNRELEKEEKQLEAAQDIIAGSDPEIRSSFAKLYPELKNDDVAYARFIAKGGKGVEALAKGYIQPNQFLDAAIAGEPMAARLAAVTQAERTGQPLEVVARDVQDALTFAKNPALALETMQKSGLLNPKQVKEFQSKMMMATGKDKEKVVQEINTMIPSLMQKKSLARLENDMESWPTIPGQPSLLADPIFGNIYQGLKTSTGRKPTFMEASKQFLNQPDITNEERTTRQARLLQAYEAVLAKNNKGIFGTPIAQGEISDRSRKMKQSLTAEMVADTWAKRFGSMVGDVARGSNEYSPVKNMFNIGRDIINAEIETLDQFLAGLTGGNK